MSRLSFLIFLNAALWFLAGTLYHTKSKGINEISSRVDDITLRCKTRLGGGKHCYTSELLNGQNRVDLIQVVESQSVVEKHLELNRWSMVLLFQLLLASYLRNLSKMLYHNRKTAGKFGKKRLASDSLQKNQDWYNLIEF